MIILGQLEQLYKHTTNTSNELHGLPWLDDILVHSSPESSLSHK